MTAFTPTPTHAASDDDERIDPTLTDQDDPYPTDEAPPDTDDGDTIDDAPKDVDPGQTLIPADPGTRTHEGYGKELMRDIAQTPTPDVVDDSQKGLAQIASAFCVQLVDPILHSIKDNLVMAKQAIMAAQGVPWTYKSSESGEVFNKEEADKRIAYDASKGKAFETSGNTFSQRSSKLLVWAGKLSPWAETIGIVVYISALWNIYWLQPWKSGWGPFITAVVMVLIMPLTQVILVGRAGREHNSYRLNKLEGLAAAARTNLVNRNSYLMFAFMIAVVGTIILSVRAILALDEPNVGLIGIFIALAAIVGFGAPAMAYLAKALDGTRYSREHDDLVGQREDYAAEVTGHVAAAEAYIQQAKDDEVDIETRQFPLVLRKVRDQPGSHTAEDIHDLIPLQECARVALTHVAHLSQLEAQLKDIKAAHSNLFSEVGRPAAQAA